MFELWCLRFKLALFLQMQLSSRYIVEFIKFRNLRFDSFLGYTGTKLRQIVLTLANPYRVSTAFALLIQTLLATRVYVSLAIRVLTVTSLSTIAQVVLVAYEEGVTTFLMATIAHAVPAIQASSMSYIFKI